MIIKFIRLIIAGLWVISTPTIAGSAAGAMRVTATVVSSCTLGAKSAISLESHDPASRATSTTDTGETLNVTCNPGADWKMFSNQALTKAMTEKPLISRATFLNQTTNELFADANTSSVITGIGTGAPQPFLIYTKAASGLNAYSETHKKIISLTLVY